jgi:hypothetical protein
MELITQIGMLIVGFYYAVKCQREPILIVVANMWLIGSILYAAIT